MRDTLAVAKLCAAAFCVSYSIVYGASSAHAEVSSCYGREHGQTRTADGHSYDPSGLTAAHRALPFGTMIRVTNLRNGRFVTVRINDRGPFVRGRDIGLSLAACRAIGNSGLVQVRLDYVPKHGDFGAF
jgi:rare lipoprotein A